MKKAFFISRFFSPSAGAGAQRTAPLAKYLREFDSVAPAARPRPDAPEI
ncbi:MAG: hypothetical protein ACLQVA_03835 [Candidatus Brocadiia bacterium]